MRVVTIMASYNEERYIAGCLEHLFSQGVEVYLLDNGSTDRTIEIAEGYLGRGLIEIEPFPREDDIYRWEAILKRKEEVAATIEADWFMHADPDEIRLPPRPDTTLVEAFTEVDKRGYNAVNFMEFTFVPTREAPDHDHPGFLQTMKHYYPFVRNFPFHVKAWKQQPERVDLAGSGGHRVGFADQRLYPESFRMKHYPYLSVRHIISKYIEKKYDTEELEKGWHSFRTQVREEKIEFPPQAELNSYTAEDELDISNPRMRHVMQDWAPPHQSGQDSSFTSVSAGHSPTPPQISAKRLPNGTCHSRAHSD